MSTTHINLKPITLKNSETFHNWQYTLKGALLLKKLWPLVTSIKKHPTVLPPQLSVKPDLPPPLVSQAIGRDTGAQAQAQAQAAKHAALTLEATQHTVNINTQACQATAGLQPTSRCCPWSHLPLPGPITEATHGRTQVSRGRLQGHLHKIQANQGKSADAPIHPLLLTEDGRWC